MTCGVILSIKYWVSNPFEAVKDELISRLNTNNNQLAIQGFKFPLLDTPAIATCFLADHGNIPWRAGLTIIASENDGQGKPVKVAHLLGKNLYDILIKTAQAILHKGLRHLQDCALLVIQNNIGAENDEDIQQECLLVPRKAFINSYVQPFQKFFMTDPVDEGNENQKVLVDCLEWKTIEQSGSLLYDPTVKVISGVSWQNPDQEEVKKEFWDGRVVSFSNSSTLIMYPIIVLGGGDTEWVRKRNLKS
jgi:hypothetical protein